MSYGLPCPTSPPGSKCWMGQQHIVALCGSWWPQDRVSVWVVAVFSLLSFLFSRSLNHRFAPKGTLPHCPNRKRYPTPEHFTPTMRPTMHRPWGAPRQREQAPCPQSLMQCLHTTGMPASPAWDSKPIPQLASWGMRPYWLAREDSYFLSFPCSLSLRTELLSLAPL